MSEFAHYLLDLLGEIGGGRGDSADDLARFTLGLIFWLLLIGSVVTIRRLHPHREKSVLLTGMCVGAGRELLMLVTHSLALYEVVPASELNAFVVPLEHALMMVARILIASAFLFYLMDNHSTARRFLQIGLGGVVVFYLATAYPWYSMLTEDPQLRFTEFVGGWLAHGWGAVTMGVALFLLALSNSIRPLVICIPFALFLSDDLLLILNLITAEAHASNLTPISQAFHIFALPWFGYIYWREQIDEQLRLSAKLIEAERLEVVGQLAAGIAHDFNNHLQAILGHAQTPVESHTDLKAVSQRFEQITESVEKASTLVHRLLAFRADDIDTEVEAINLNAVVKSLAPMLTGLLLEDQRISYRLDTRDALIRADLASIEQSVVNLILNARDAMPQGGEVHVSTTVIQPCNPHRKDSHTVRLSISDTGSGMDEYTLKHVFEPFFTTKGVGKGTGLGLATVYNNLHRLGGQASINSRPGSGTTVTLDFPGLHEAEIGHQPVDEPKNKRVTTSRRIAEQGRLSHKETLANVATRPRADKCILLAEGNPAVRNTASAQLRSAGYTVVAVANGETAIQSMHGTAGNKVDLLVLSTAMPKIGGYDAFDAIEKRHPGILVIFLSDQTQPASLQRTEHAHLIKPYHRDQLLKTVRSILCNVPVRA